MTIIGSGSGTGSGSGSASPQDSSGSPEGTGARPVQQGTPLGQGNVTEVTREGLRNVVSDRQAQTGAHGGREPRRRKKRGDPNAMVPDATLLSAGDAVVAESSTTVPAAVAEVTLTTSFVPVMATVTVCVVVEPWPSSMVTTYFSVTLWPAARYWAAASLMV